MQIPFGHKLYFSCEIPLHGEFLVMWNWSIFGVKVSNVQKDITDKMTSLQLISSKMNNSKDVNLDE